MDEIDRLTVAMLWDTSSPGARARYRRDERWGWPAYDEEKTVSIWPRDHAATCANPACRRVFVVAASAGGARRHCSAACRQGACYWRRKEGAA